MVLILDLGVGQRGALHDRPQHRPGAAIEPAVHGEFTDLAGDLRFGVVGHGRIGICPIADHAEPLKLRGLDLDPALREFPAFLAEFEDRHLVLIAAGGAVFFLDLPFDRQTVTVPARDIIGVLAHHLLRAVDDVFQNLVQRMTDMQVAVRVGRAIVEDEFFPAARKLALFGKQIHRRPAVE